ncbi:DUF2391 family protein [Halorussus sp. AFM4]|uniref:DUF2391 family protein n=1 Tax=Halorussus sp. AFM4 TaxID=3421651 RepID=UPI003EB9B112
MSQRGTQSAVEELREQGRAIVGALVVVGTTFLYTMESWWWGWTLSATHLLVYAVVGLGVVLVVTRQISFRGGQEQEETGERDPLLTTATDFADLVLQSFIASYVVLLTFGVVEIGDPLVVVARLGLIEVVPLGFGAALANKLFSGNERPAKRSLTATLGVYSIGAIFLAGGIAPTQEMELIATYMGWERTAVLVVLSLVTAYVMLYELNLQGQEHRLQGRSKAWQFGRAFLVYAVALVVGTALLAGFGHFVNTPLPVIVQLVVVISFITSIGASAAEVVI